MAESGFDRVRQLAQQRPDSTPAQTPRSDSGSAFDRIRRGSRPQEPAGEGDGFFSTLRDQARAANPITSNVRALTVDRSDSDPAPEGNFITQLPDAVRLGLRSAKDSIGQLIATGVGAGADLVGANDFASGIREAAAQDVKRSSDERRRKLGVPADIAAGVVQFTAGAAATGGFGRAGAIAGRAGSTFRQTVANSARTGALADFVAFSPDDGNLSSILPGSDINPLAITGDEGQLAGRLKNVAEGSIVGVAADAAFRGIGRGIRSARGQNTEGVSKAVANAAGAEPVAATKNGEALFDTAEGARKFAEQKGIRGDDIRVEPAEGVGFRLMRGDQKIKLDPKDAELANIRTLQVVDEVGKAMRGGSSILPRLAVEIFDTVKKGARAEFGTMIGRLDNVGTPLAKAVAKRVRDTADLTAKFRGRLAEPLVAAQRSIGAFDPLRPVESFGRLKAASRLTLGEQKDIGDGFGYAVSRFQDVMNGRVDPANKFEAGIKTAVARLTSARGKLFESVGLLQKVGDDEVRPFVDQGGEIHVRFMTGELIDIIEKGQTGRLWKPVIRAFADAAEISEEAVETFFRQARDDFASGVGKDGQAAFRRVQAEFTRTLPRVPDVLFDGGSRIELLETNPFKYVNRLANDGSSRAAVIAKFGQGPIDPESNLLADIQKRFVEEQGDDKILVEVMRAMSGMQVEQPFLNPGGIPGRTKRGIDNAMTPVRSLMLSGTALLQPLESLATTLPLVGTRDYLNGLAKIFNPVRANRHEVIAHLEALGAITKAIGDFVFDPNRKFESTGRIFSEMVGRLSLFIQSNELNEKIAGAAALSFRDRMIAGNIKKADFQRLVNFGFDRETAERIMRGGGTEAELDAIVSRAPGLTGGAPLQAVEKSRFENRRAVRSLVFFQGYAQPKVRAFARSAQTMMDSMRSAFERPGLTPQERWREASRATNQFTNLVIGTTAAGVGNYFILAGMTGGTTGTNIAWNEFRDRPLGFLQDSFTFSMLAGPYGSILRAGAAAGSVDEDPISAFIDSSANGIVPIVVAQEITNFMLGKGTRYEGRTWGEGALALSDRFIAANDIVRGLAATVGLASDKNRDLEESIDAYWRWRFAVDPPTERTERVGSEGPLETEAEIKRQNRVFAVNMRRALEAMKGDSPPEVIRGHIARAVGESGKDLTSVQRSLNRRRLVSQWLPREDDTPEERLRDSVKLRSLRDRIGAEAFKNIMAHDKLIDDLVNTIKAIQ